MRALKKITKFAVMLILVLTHVLTIFLLLAGMGLLELPKTQEYIVFLLCILSTSLYTAIGLGTIDRGWVIK